MFAVEHVTQKATKVTEGGPTYSPGPLEETRAAVQKAVEEYASSHFSDGCCAVNTYEKDGEIIVCLSGSKANLRNYWSGKWRSEWHLDPKGKTASGKIKTAVHFFEDGNVQLDQNKDVPKSSLDIKGSDDKAFAEAVSEFIKKQENAVHDTLEEIYQNFSQETFKDMRRILPVSKTRMDWTGAQMRLASTMGKGKQ